jgi:glucosamine-6-phosphate deaminase
MSLKRTFQVDQMQVCVYDTNDKLGAAAAEDLVRMLVEVIAEQGEAAIIVATGNSQLSFIKALRAREEIDWSKVRVFHMDEYLGIAADHPASFRRYIREKLTDVVHAREFFGVEGDAPDAEAELARYAALLRQYRPVACVLGIGENGHLAFNDPPADFACPEPIQVVTLAETARLQQVGEGHFASLEEVPEQAITLTIPTLLEPRMVLAVVPEARKAPAVQAALEGPITPDCPASILRTHGHVTLYLDAESAALLRPA